MKASKFNIRVEHKDNVYLTNTFTKSIIQINDSIDKNFKQNTIDLINKVELDYLVSKGFVIEDEIDEVGLLRYRANKLKSSKKEMEFVLCPTLECNFECTYCFESPRKGCMSEVIQKKVLNYIYEKTQDPENEKIHIIWFGGEPLLYPNIVTKMNTEIYNYCKKHNKSLQSDVITNGYNLSQELVEKLIKAHINHLQITLDGCKKNHDMRRILKNGCGTYNTIYTNLKNLKDKPLTVVIRINVDKSNIDTISELENDILNLDNPNINCHPAIVELSSKHYEDIQDKCYFIDKDLQTFYDHPNIDKYYSSCKCSDFGLRLFFCEAEHENSFVIDELGNIYKCWNSIGNDKEILCTLDNRDINPCVASNYLARDPFTEQKCIDCPYIPICGGGCVKQKILHNTNICAESRFNFLKVVKKSIDSYESERRGEKHDVN